MKPYEQDFDDYLAERGGVYLPFPAAVRFIYELDWCRSVWEALLAGIRPPASRVADMLRFLSHQKAYLPPDLAADYPTVPNPWGQG